MSDKNGGVKAKGKSERGKSEKAPAGVFPVFFPSFSIGALILPLIIPRPPGRKKK